MAYLNFEIPAVERLCERHPHTRPIFEALELKNSAENLEIEAYSAQGTRLAEEQRTRKGELAQRDQRYGGRPRINDVDENGRVIPPAPVIDEHGNKIQGRNARDYMGGEYDLESHRLPFLRRIEAADRAYAAHLAQPKPAMHFGETCRAVLDFCKSAKGPFTEYTGQGFCGFEQKMGISSA